MTLNRTKLAANNDKLKGHKMTVSCKQLQPRIKGTRGSKLGNVMKTMK